MWLTILAGIAVIALAPPVHASFCGNDPVNNVDPLGERAYGKDFTGPIQEPWDWIEPQYTQKQVDDVYAYLASRDRHIYNPGLANDSDYRVGNDKLLEHILGVPVTMVENWTFTEVGHQIGKFGRYIGRNGWTWRPDKMLGNIIGGTLEVVGKPVKIVGAVIDFPIAGAGKVLPYDPAIRETRVKLNRALRDVQVFDDDHGRVFMWMHSEGAIHGSQVLNNIDKKTLKKIQGYTFGAGGLGFEDGVNVLHNGTLNDVGNKDPVLEYAAWACGKRSLMIEWKQVDRGYVHGFPTYAEAFMVRLAKQYFVENEKLLIRGTRSR